MIGLLIIASSIWSPSIDAWFSFPKWMPTVVAAKNTPGNDPAGGDGSWYIEEMSTNGVPTGRWVPRSPRLSKEIAASIFGAFSGYFERQYYALQGQTNNWDTAIYGPLHDKRKFWFDQIGSEAEAGNTLFQDWEYCYNTNNRCITSRRLSEWKEIDALASRLLKLSELGWCVWGVHRPCWIKPDWDEYGPWWSTQDTKILDGTEIVPEFDWCPNPCTNDWSKCSQSFACLSPDNVWIQNPNRVFTPLNGMMEGLSFGSTLGYPWDSCVPSKVSASMRDMIETNFPHANGWAITKDTKRLFSDRLCCMDQVLSLMDRTYHRPELAYPTVGTNIYYRLSRSATGYAKADLTWNASRQTYVGTSESIEWESSTNRLKTVGLPLVTCSFALQYRKTQTETGCSVTAGDSPRNIITFGAVDDDFIKRQAELAGVVDGMVIVDVFPQTSPLGYSVVVWDGDTGMTNILTRTESAYAPDVSNAELVVVMDYYRHYHAAKSIGNMLLYGPSQPGWESTEKAVDSRYAGVIGIHYRDDSAAWNVDDYSINDMGWNDEHSDSEYKSYTATYFLRPALEARIRALNTAARDRMEERFGDPFDPLSYIPISAADFNRVMNSVKLQNLTVNITPAYVNSSALCYIEGGIVTEVCNQSTSTEDESFEGYLDLFRVGIGAEEEHSSPNQKEHDPLAVDIEFGIITRVDWLWSTLRRAD